MSRLTSCKTVQALHSLQEHELWSDTLNSSPILAVLVTVLGKGVLSGSWTCFVECFHQSQLQTEN